MPTYDLKCKACGEKFETFVTRLIKDEDKVCPSCGSHEVTTGLGGGFLGTGTSTGRVEPSCGSGGFG